MFSCEIQEIFKSTFLSDHLQATASDSIKKQVHDNDNYLQK